jgi:phosphopantothenoylcysteine synthetase/decarboxylase
VGFDADRNAVTILTRDGGVVEVPETTKWEVAHRVLDAVVALKQRQAATIRS